MKKLLVRSLVTVAVFAAPFALGADWTQYRGAGGQGKSNEKGLPVEWSSQQNIAWKTELPGPGTSSPITLRDRVFLTSYTGYGLKPAKGDMNNLKRHLLCINRNNGNIKWSKQFDPELPEHKYQGEGSYHGYSSSTPATDGERLYVFFGKSGVYCFDLDGKQLWHADVGSGTNRWGSANSPVLYKNLVLINASVESDSLVALDKSTGDEVWRAGGIGSSWNTPVLVDVPAAQTELVVSVRERILGFDPENGKELWRSEGIHRYVCPSVVVHKNIVFAIGGGHTSLAVRAGGRGDVTKSHGLWRQSQGSNVSSPIYHNGHLYWASDSHGIVYCQNAKTGEFVYNKRLTPGSGLIYASPILADGKLYYVSQRKGTYVVAAKPEFELLAHNVFEDDDSRTNASPIANNGQLLLRTDRALYCIGKKSGK